MYDLLIICSGQGTCPVWTNTYRDNWQNEERVQGERLEKHILISELSVQCWAMGYKYIYFFWHLQSHFFPFYNDNWMGFSFSYWECYGSSVRPMSHRSTSWVWPPPDWGWGYPTNRNQTTPSLTSWNQARYNINFKFQFQFIYWTCFSYFI